MISKINNLSVTIVSKKWVVRVSYLQDGKEVERERMIYDLSIENYQHNFVRCLWSAAALPLTFLVCIFLHLQVTMASNTGKLASKKVNITNTTPKENFLFIFSSKLHR